MWAELRALGRRFAAGERGNVAVIFAAVLVPVIGITASAIDYGRASKAREQLQKASDGAVEAASRHLDGDRDAIIKVIRTHLDVNLPEDLRKRSEEHTSELQSPC